MELPDTYIDKLRRLVRAGADGLQLGDGLGAGSALFFGLHGLATITNTKAAPQRAVATRRAGEVLRQAEMFSGEFG